MPKAKKAKKTMKTKKVAKKAVKKNVKKTAKKVIKKSVKKPLKKTAKKTAKKTVKKAKSKKVSVIPKGYHSITPYLIVHHAAKAIAFYQKAFGAKVVMLVEKEGGKIGHAELQVGDSRFMLADEHPEVNAVGPQGCHPSPVGIHVYIKDVDAVVERAIAAGAKLTRPVADMFYGDRAGGIEDPFGHSWYIATHIENVTPAVIRKRLAAMTHS